MKPLTAFTAYIFKIPGPVCMIFGILQHHFILNLNVNIITQYPNVYDNNTDVCNLRLDSVQVFINQT